MMQKVLIADDDYDARVLWSAVVETENLTPVEAEDGRQALEILKTDDDFALIILDVNMPYVEGYDVLKFIRGQDELKEIPVIISTSDRTTRSLTGVVPDEKTVFINKASGLDNMRRGVAGSLGRKVE